MADTLRAPQGCFIGIFSLRDAAAPRLLHAMIGTGAGRPQAIKIFASAWGAVGWGKSQSGARSALAAGRRFLRQGDNEVLRIFIGLSPPEPVRMLLGKNRRLAVLLARTPYLKPAVANEFKAGGGDPRLMRVDIHSCSSSMSLHHMACISPFGFEIGEGIGEGAWAGGVLLPQFVGFSSSVPG